MARKSKKSKAVKAKEQRERMKIRREALKNKKLEITKDLNQDMQDEMVSVSGKEFIKNNFNDVRETLGSSPLVKNLGMETIIEINKLSYEKESTSKNLSTELKKNLEDTNKNKKSDSKLDKTLVLNLDEQLDLNLDEQLDLKFNEQLDLKMDKKLDLNLELNFDKKSDLNLDEQSDINFDKQLDLNLDKHLELNLDKHLELNLNKHSDFNFDNKEANGMLDLQFNSNCNKQLDSNLYIGQDKITSLKKNTCEDNRITSCIIDSVGVSRSAVGNKVVQGSFHQGDRRFGVNSGKQCVANCLSALAHSKSKDLNYWNQMYLDTVLIAGNQLYSHIHGNNDHLFISDLPEMVEISGKLVKILRKESITAVIDSSGTIDFSEFGNSLPLDQALQESLIDCDACFICAYDTTFVVIKHDQDLFLFDSHARNEFGLQHSDGKSLLLKLSSLDHLYQYCCNMKAGASQNQWFETTGVNIDVFGEEPRNQSFVELPRVYHLMKVYDNELPEIQETRNMNATNEVPKNQKGMNNIHGISPKIHVLDSKFFRDKCNNVRKKIDETNFDGVITDNESDIEILSTSDIIYDFKPLTLVLKRKLCGILKITTKHILKPFSPNIFQMGPPSATKTITGDGNCLFRAISYALSNRQEFFQTIRKTIVAHLMRNEEMFKSFLQPRFGTVQEHIQTLKMEQNFVWGTELEIIACADLLKTDIFTFYNGSWIKYSSTQICSKNNVNVEAIYLKHESNINHYEVVTAVTHMSDLSLNRLQSSEVHRKRHMIEKTPLVRTKKINVEESQMADFNHQFDDNYVRSKAGKQKRKYHSDTLHKENKKTQVQNAYWESEETRLKKIQSGKEKYRDNQVYRKHLIAAGVKKYKQNNDYREKLIQTGIQKYQENDDYREKMIQAGIQKYQENDDYREKMIQTGIQKYQENDDYREKLIQTGVCKYKKDEEYREKLKEESKQRYANDDTHKLKIKQQTATRRENFKEENKQINDVIRKFKEEVRKGPECVCACCLRLFFEKQVLNCKKDSYDNSLYELCITDKYQHKCTDDCEKHCGFEGTCRTSLWICYTCHRKILKSKIPAESFSNGLLLEEVPFDLKQLNTIEQQLISQNIPFMKIMALPKGGQKGVHGPVVCVPSDLKKVTSILPRSEDESLLLKVKLKRKLSYKGYDQYQFVRPNHLEQALLYLKDKNMWYKDVAINNEWINPIPGSNDDQVVNEDSDSDDTELVGNNQKQEDVIEKMIKSSTTGNEREVESEPDNYIDDRLRGVQLDTCLQPADIGQEALDLCFDQVFNIAPAENNSPLSVLQEPGIEAKTFPVHFPSGKNTFDEDRDEKLTIGRYSNLRLMSVENRFARDTSYIFFSQYLTELNSVISNVQVSLRKECPFSKEGKKVTGEMLCNKKTLKELFKKDEAIKYLKPIRGTPPYWQSSQKDIFAMIRQLGVPTFFCSFSSADFRWSEIVNTILKQQGDMRNTENMTWDEKCKVLSSNPVTAARMFDHRFHTFLKNVIMSDAEPIGKINDYFYRVEFQQRGSPHTHCLFWVENAPKFDEDENEEVMSFIDKYITCEIPDEKEDKELHDIVMAVHQHSKNHSKTCRKKGTVCRFNFPRPPSTRTFISIPSDPDKDSKEDEEVAKEILSDLWQVIKDHEDESLDVSEIFKKAGLTQESFEKYFCFITNRNTVVLKREPNEIYTNQYNPHLLRAWNANMDIQYILDAFSCVVYIISYISKAERELGLLLQQTKNEAEEGNLNAQQTMKKIGTAYLHHREVSAQEAVFRVTGLRLRECSRKVEFIPVGENPCRMSIPLKDLEKKQSFKSSKRKRSNSDSEDEDESRIWMNSIVDRYKGRPHIDIFFKMCLARFSSEYCVLRESQLPQKINEETTFKLDGNLGYVRKRTRTSPAVIKYPRFSQETSPEKYFQSILQLFLPYRYDEQLKPPLFHTYENFFACGRVKFPGEDALSSVKQVVTKNMSDFVKNGQDLEEAEKQLHDKDPKEDAWCELCPEAEVIRRECIDEGNVTSVIEEDLSEAAIPDLNNEKSSSSVGTNLLSVSLTKNEIIPRLRSLNVKQRRILYKVRDWCIQKANGKTPEPLHLFITGGAGTGKSHLIKCIQYEATRILAQTSDNPDDLTVLLTAPTGTAAFNIHGLTIHSALGIFKSLSPDHATLSEDKINSLRAKLENLQILIIDEISMVNKKLLFFIHERLRQVKKRPDNCLFGGVSVIAVGDFYQLPPVRTKRVDKLYVDDPSNPSNQLWNGLFEIAELDEIMRQREDGLFAELLNRLRVKQKNESLSLSDKETLKHCFGDGPDEALHIYSTNSEVDNFNKEMIMKLSTESKLIEAEDYEKNKTSGKLTLKKIHCTKSDVCLPISILLAEGARVMLIKNEDTADGLVNGVMGTVISIKEYSPNSLPSTIYVHFDNERVGKNAKLQKIISGKRCVALKPSSEDIPLSNCVRKQFPLKLAWACTIHKVQGLTVEECVVDLNKCFTYGQAYVAISRVTSKSGLHIKSIETEKIDKKIFCDPDIVKGFTEMTRFLLEVEDEGEEQTNTFQIMYHNIQGLQTHAEDMKQNPDFRNADYICLTETWANQEFNCFEMMGYDGFHLPRSLAFENDNSYYSSLKEMQHGGVCVFYKLSSETEICNLTSNLECIVFKITSKNVLVATVYRTQKYNLGKFLENFETLICKLEELSEKIVVIGDFNQDILKGGCTVFNFMSSKGFRQLVSCPTTEGGTLIDHVYVKGCPYTGVAIIPTYYSYHEALKIVIHCDKNEL